MSIAVGVLIADAISKILVVRQLGPDADRHSVEIVPGWVEVTYSENDGVAFGLLQGSSTIVWIAVFAALLLGAWFIATSMNEASTLLTIGLALSAGGALGNIANRLFSGHVVDFITLWQWPSFNVADAALTVGLLTIVFDQFRQATARPN